MKAELVALRAKLPGSPARLGRLLVRETRLLDDSARSRLAQVLATSQPLATVHEFRERLKSIWEGAATSNERLIAQVREWCAQAEASGIRSLQEFAASLKSYGVQTA
jgi:stearoyl-CoA desaturase (delta-9 desaturase)